MDGLEFDLNIHCDEITFETVLNDWAYMTVEINNDDFGTIQEEGGSGISHTGTANWKPNNIGRETFFGVWRFSLGKMVLYKAYADGLPYNEEYYAKIAAHEFGHVLGLDDAYASANEGIKIIGNKEIVMVDADSKYMMMYLNDKVCTNEVEMVLEAFVTGDFQRFVTTSYGKVSNVIRLQQRFEE